MAVYLGNNQVDLLGGDTKAPNISSLTVTPTENQQTFDEAAITGYKPVTVGAIASDYVGSAIPLKSSADITEAAMYYNSMGPRIRHDINFSSGYYSTTGQKAIYTNIADITSMPTLSAQTITPTESVQYISSYQWLTGSQTIAAIPSSYIIPSGTYSVTENGIYDIGSYASVDVNVAGGGGFTVDQIAMRTISGGISGNASIIGSCAFAYCTSLTSVSFPSCTKINISAFTNCSRLTSINFPICMMISSYAFYNCPSLTSVSFPSCTTISDYAFRYCYNLLSVYLLGSSIPSIGSSIFRSTPIDGYTTSTGGVYGSIYVPASLYSNYLTATKWSVYSSRIVSV